VTGHQLDTVLLTVISIMVGYYFGENVPSKEVDMTATVVVFLRYCPYANSGQVSLCKFTWFAWHYKQRYLLAWCVVVNTGSNINPLMLLLNV
ncbi:MAG: hypothetical protein AAF125_23385, partial [Chloroflexota bacterium]